MFAKDLKHGHTFVFRDKVYKVIVSISKRDECLVNVVCTELNGASVVINFHKNFPIAATGSTELITVLSMTDEELKLCKPYREVEDVHG